MNKEEIIEYINAKRKPISHCVDLTKYFIGRHKTLPVYLTRAFEQEFNSSMHELEKLREENKKYKEVIDKLKKHCEIEINASNHYLKNHSSQKELCHKVAHQRILDILKELNK